MEPPVLLLCFSSFGALSLPGLIKLATTAIFSIGLLFELDCLRTHFQLSNGGRLNLPECVCVCVWSIFQPYFNTRFLEENPGVCACLLSYMVYVNGRCGEKVNLSLLNTDCLTVIKVSAAV